MNCLLLQMFTLNSCVLFISSEKVLMLMHLQGSHVTESSTFGIELSKRGHEVYTILPETSKYVSLRKKGISVITFPATLDEIFMESDSFNDFTSYLPFDNELSTLGKLMELMKMVKNVTKNHCKGYLENKEIMENVKKIGFNIAIVDSFGANYCHYLLPNILNIPTVSIFSSIPFWNMGVPALPSFVPQIILPFSDQMTFKERIINTIFVILTSTSYSPVQWDQELLRKYAPGEASWLSLSGKTQLFIGLRDEVLEKPVPRMPNTIFLPGISYSPAAKLPSKFQKIYNEATKGVIVMSFGSTFGFVPNFILQNFFTTFAKLSEFTFLIKFPLESKQESIKHFKIPRNVHLLEWLPQNDCLGHEKTILFITHSGNNGQYEAIYHGVPMLAFPISSDQFHNAHRIANRGYGLSLDIHTFVPSDLEKAIVDIVNNKSILDNVKMASSLIKDREHPKYEGVFWIEHVMKFGGQHLRGASMDMPWYKLLMVDVILFLLSICVILVIGIVYLFKVAYYFCRGKKNKID